MGLEDFATWLQATSFSVAIQSTAWVVPVLQSVHILMIGVVFISVLLIALRVLGWARADEAFTSVWARFAPFMWWGLAVMAVTGVLGIVVSNHQEIPPSQARHLRQGMGA